MKIMTNKRYDIICDIVMSQKKLIEQKEAEITKLKAQVERLSKSVENELYKDGYEALEDRACYEYMFNGINAIKDIDFPNSHDYSEKKISK